MNQSLGLLDQNPLLAQELRPQIREYPSPDPQPLAHPPGHFSYLSLCVTNPRT